MGGRAVVVVLVGALLAAAALVTRPWQRRDVPATGPAAGSAVATSGTPAALEEASPAAAPAAATGRWVDLPATRAKLRLPEGYAVAEDPADLSAVEAAAACPPAVDYCVYALPGSGAPAAGLGVTVRGDLASEADCALEPLPGFEANLPSVSGSSDHVAARFGTVARPAAGATVTTGLRRLHFGGVCFEFVSRVVTSGGQQPEAARGEVVAIVDGLTLPDGRSRLWTGGR